MASVISSRVIQRTSRASTVRSVPLVSTYRNRADGMHALRHFYVSTLLSRGVAVTELSRTTSAIPTRIHLADLHHHRAGQAVDALFARPTDTDGK